MNAIQHNILAASIMFCPAFSMVVSGQQAAHVSFASMSVTENTTESQLEGFLTSSANTTAINIADCNLALKRCSVNAIKSFSMEVMKEQQGLMKQIKALALKNEIIIPFDSFVKRNNQLSQLSKEADFDAKFLHKIITTLEINVDAFRAASECDDRWVRLFIADALPVLEGQLVKARALGDTLK